MNERASELVPDQQSTERKNRAAATVSGVGNASAETPPTPAAVKQPVKEAVGGLRSGMLGFMLAHEQFTVPRLVKLGALANHSGFDLLATSDHFQPWQ